MTSQPLRVRVSDPEGDLLDFNLEEGGAISLTHEEGGRLAAAGEASGLLLANGTKALVGSIWVLPGDRAEPPQVSPTPHAGDSRAQDPGGFQAEPETPMAGGDSESLPKDGLRGFAAVRAIRRILGELEPDLRKAVLDASLSLAKWGT